MISMRLVIFKFVDPRSDCLQLELGCYFIRQCSTSDKKYFVVHFTSTNEVEYIPSKWIFQNEEREYMAYFPNNYSSFTSLTWLKFVKDQPEVTTDSFTASVVNVMRGYGRQL